MAQVANTYETYDQVGARETLSDDIHNITPEETPFTKMAGRRKISGIHPEWQTATNRTPVTTNDAPEGNDWTYSAVVPTVRVGNYAQISDASVIISQTAERNAKAGRNSEMAREITDMLVELRTDIEVNMLSNNASSAGSGDAATNRKSAGLRAWIASNDSLGSSGASGGFNTSTSIVDAATNGDQRAFTKTLLDATILSTHTGGGKLKALMCSPYVKTVFDTFMSDSNVVPMRRAATASDSNTIVGTAEFYQSAFGLLAVVPNVQMARAGAAVARNAFLIDPDKLAMGTFRDINVVTPAVTGDAIKKVAVCEYSLLVDNEACQGVVADLYGLSAST